MMNAFSVFIFFYIFVEYRNMIYYEKQKDFLRFIFNFHRYKYVFCILHWSIVAEIESYRYFTTDLEVLADGKFHAVPGY